MNTTYFYKYSFEPLDSKMYITIENNRALMIDCIPSESAEKLLLDNNIKDITIIITHEHFDHILGLNGFREKFNCFCLCSELCGKNIKSDTKNLSKMSEILFMNKDTNIKILPFISFADEFFAEDFCFQWETHKIQCKITPGHSEGSICIIVDDKYLFSGDTLVDGYKIITRLPGGSKKKYNEITLPFIKSIKADTLVFPGHGNPKLISEFEF